jgi:hypothetical protein
MNVVFVHPTYKTPAEVAAEAKQISVTKPAEEELDLDTALERLDDELKKLDELISRQQEFPSHISRIEARLRELESLDLPTMAALESRQAEQGKLLNMKLLADSQAKKLKTAIGVQQEAVIKIGGRAADLVEKLWSDLHQEAFAQARVEFDRLFFHAFEHPDVLSKFRPVALVEWLRPPDLFTSSVDVKITRIRALRARTEKLKAFAEMTFQEVSDELAALDDKTREQSRINAANRLKVYSRPSHLDVPAEVVEAT